LVEERANVYFVEIKITINMLGYALSEPK